MIRRSLPPAPRAYAQACVRLGVYGGYTNSVPPAYCLSIGDALGAGGAAAAQCWAITAGVDAAGAPVVLANGSLPAGFDPAAAWHTLQVAAVGHAPPRVTAALDGAPLTPAAGVDASARVLSSGLALLGCGYHTCSFDDFAVATTA